MTLHSQHGVAEYNVPVTIYVVNMLQHMANVCPSSVFQLSSTIEFTILNEKDAHIAVCGILKRTDVVWPVSPCLMLHDLIFSTSITVFVIHKSCRFQCPSTVI